MILFKEYKRRISKIQAYLTLLCAKKIEHSGAQPPGLLVHTDIIDENATYGHEWVDVFVPYGDILIRKIGFFDGNSVRHNYPGCEQFDECTVDEWCNYLRCGDFITPLCVLKNLSGELNRLISEF